MKRKSASTLIYFSERARKRSLVGRSKHVNKEKRAKTVRWIVVLLSSLLAGSAGVWAYYRYRPLDITDVTIEGAQRFVNAQDVQTMVQEKSLGRNIILIDIKNLERIISSNFLASKSVKISYQLPRSLKVQIKERTPIALILPEKSQEFYFVDLDGFVLGLANKSTTNLPVINYGQQVEVGIFVEPSAVSYYFDLIKALDEDGISVSTISSYPRYTQFFTGEGNQVLFSNAQSAKSQVKIFVKMMEAFKAEGKKVAKIDLRFDKVIVELVNKEEKVQNTESIREAN